MMKVILAIKQFLKNRIMSNGTEKVTGKGFLKWVGWEFGSIFIFLSHMLDTNGLVTHAIAAGAGSLNLVGHAPGNVFLEGESLTFSMTETVPAFSYVVKDYDGRSVAQDNVSERTFTIAPQPRGYYELEWKAGRYQGRTSFAVLPSRPDEAPPSGPLAVDGSIVWLCRPEQWVPVAKMLRRAGIGWVRERLSWREVEPKEGQFDWGKYQTVAEALHAQGIRIYQIFHDSPEWTRPGRRTKHNPDDLRHVYHFAKEAARHFSKQVLAWEPWNEPDIAFFDQLGDRYSGIQKAAYLGFKAGNPNVKVLLCSLCRGRSAFSDNIFECGVADYMDIFNFHTYAPIQDYIANLNSWLALAELYGVADRPIWLTEAGIRLEHINEELTPERERQQAEFIPRSFAISLAAGVDRHFFFVLPFYPEGPIQFGALRRDLSPRPAFVAIATAVRLIGQGRYLGKLPGECEIYVFDNGQELMAVVWSDEPKKVNIPVGSGTVRVVDLIGREKIMTAPDGILSLRVGPAAQYILGLGASVKGQVTGKVRLRGKLPKLSPAKVVLVSYFEDCEVDKRQNIYLLDPDKPATFVVDVYNFDEQQPSAGKIALELPKGWRSNRLGAKVRLNPMGRETFRFQVTPKDLKVLTPTKVWVRGKFPGQRVSPSVSYAGVDILKASPMLAKKLELDTPTRWTPNISGNGKMEIQPVPDGGVRFVINFHGPGDRWCYPVASFPQKQDWSSFNSIALEYRFDTDDKDTVMRVQVMEEGGSHYCSYTFPATKTWRRAIVLFNDLVWGPWSPPDPNSQLDLDRVRSILVGCNTKLDNLTLEVRNLELVAFD